MSWAMVRAWWDLEQPKMRGGTMDILLIRVSSSALATVTRVGPAAPNGSKVVYVAINTGLIRGNSSVVAGRWLGSGSAGGAFVAILDSFDNVVLSKEVSGVAPVDKSQNTEATAIAADGNELLVATREMNFPKSMIRRLDPWANASCAESGPCFNKSWNDCLDTNPCTADLCDAAHNGCYHVPLPDGATCTDSGNHCKAGTCNP